MSETKMTARGEVLALAFALENLCDVADEPADDGMAWATRLSEEVEKARLLNRKIDARKYARNPHARDVKYENGVDVTESRYLVQELNGDTWKDISVTKDPEQAASYFCRVNELGAPAERRVVLLCSTIKEIDRFEPCE